MVSIYLVILFVVLNEVSTKNSSSTVRIYSNQAEFIRPLENLPLEFNDEIWTNIRSDSITLIGQNLNITSQTITEEKKSMNGSDVYIRSPISSDRTNVKLIKGILIDEDTHLVQIQDPSITDQSPLYFTVSNDQIYYTEKPTKSKYYVNFNYTSSDSNILVSYLQSNLNWRTQHRLNLHADESELTAWANIRNEGKTSLDISEAELISGDIHLQMQQQNDYSLLRKARFGNDIAFQYASTAMPMQDRELSPLTVEQGQELAGLYVFAINKPFTIKSKTNCLIPMFRPRVSVERYGLISKLFTSMLTTGKAQRSYRLRSDRYLPQGSCIIRENDHLVGETLLPNLAAKDKYEFAIGEDADIIYRENITLTSSQTYNETQSIIQFSDDKQIGPITIITRTRYVYNIDVQLQNFKNRPVKIEYEQKGLHSYQSIDIKQSRQYELIRDGSSVKMNTTLEANTIERFSYTLILVQ